MNVLGVHYKVIVLGLQVRWNGNRNDENSSTINCNKDEMLIRFDDKKYLNSNANNPIGPMLYYLAHHFYYFVNLELFQN